MQSTTVKPSSASAQKPAREARPSLPRGLRNSAVVAISLFVLINVFLWIRFGDEKVSHDLWNGAGSIDIAVDQYAQLASHPHVVLLGSSLMMYPFWAADKQVDPTIPDIFHHRHSKILEKTLHERGIKDDTVYSFAIFGQMVSDAYIYVNEYLKGDKTPEYLIYGIAPRDFHDSDLPSPTATYSFKRLVGLKNFPQYSDLYLPSLQDKADWLMGRLCYFYGHRWRLQHDVNRSIDKLYKALGLKTPGQLEEKSNAQAGFMLAGREDVRWNSSLNEYKRRYTNIENKDFDLQVGFLDRLLQTCQQRKIHVILVNMPLTDVNRELLPPEWYAAYRKKMSEEATKYGAKIVDLSSDENFVHTDFWDTTHLNHFGGHKLIQRIEPLIDQ